MIVRVLALSLALALSARAQTGAVALLVIDDATDAAVSDVRVSILGQPAERVTDAHGRFMYVSPSAGRVAFVLRRTTSIALEDSGDVVLALARRGTCVAD